MPATYVETRQVQPSDLHPYPGKAKFHDREGLRDSVTSTGQYRSVVARLLDDGTLQLLAGHGTTDAIAEAGHGVRVEVITCTDAEARRIVLADNALGARAGYDESALLALLDLANADGGLAATGYDEQAYQDLIAAVRPRATPDDIDDTPEPPAEPTTRPGSIWTLGQHRLVCGSGLVEGTLQAAVHGRPVAVVHVDPPYGIKIVSADGTLGDAGGYRPVIGDDDTTTATIAYRLLTNYYPDARHIWWGANHYAGDTHLPNSSCWLVWDKQNGGTDFADCELAWTNHHGAVRRLVHRWNGRARASEAGPRMHPNQKPVALIRWAIETTIPVAEIITAGGILLDVCAGSGPSLLAAELLNIPAALVEIDPAYCDVIAHRWAQLTGLPPLLDGEPVDPMRLALGA